ncbi:hypothetical protein AHF37_09921 [Paragonimus kellicotti]|nr:hypothetical protein AHF37_09921 [Paragonimus kellicotti]
MLTDQAQSEHDQLILPPRLLLKITDVSAAGNKRVEQAARQEAIILTGLNGSCGGAFAAVDDYFIGLESSCLFTSARHMLPSGYSLAWIANDAAKPSFGLSVSQWIPGGQLLDVVCARTEFSEYSIMRWTQQLLMALRWFYSKLFGRPHGLIEPRHILVARRSSTLPDIVLAGLDRESDELDDDFKASTLGITHSLSEYDRKWILTWRQSTDIYALSEHPAAIQFNMTQKGTVPPPVSDRCLQRLQQHDGLIPDLDVLKEVCTPECLVSRMTGACPNVQLTVGGEVDSRMTELCDKSIEEVHVPMGYGKPWINFKKIKSFTKPAKKFVYNCLQYNPSGKFSKLIVATTNPMLTDQAQSEHDQLILPPRLLLKITDVSAAGNKRVEQAARQEAIILTGLNGSCGGAFAAVDDYFIGLESSCLFTSARHMLPSGYSLAWIANDAAKPSFGLSVSQWIPGGQLLDVVCARTEFSEYSIMRWTQQLLMALRWFYSKLFGRPHGLIEPRHILVARRSSTLPDIVLAGLDRESDELDDDFKGNF